MKDVKIEVQMIGRRVVGVRLDGKTVEDTDDVIAAVSVMSSAMLELEKTHRWLELLAPIRSLKEMVSEE